MKCVTMCMIYPFITCLHQIDIFSKISFCCHPAILYSTKILHKTS